MQNRPSMPSLPLSGSGPVPKIAAAVVIGIVAIIALFAAFSGYDKTSGGEVAVVRNGGAFDNNRIRGVVQPGSGLTWIGMWSTMHRYPAQQRLYTITANAERGARFDADVVRTPSSDGVDMGIEGTIYYNLNLSEDSMKAFDEKFGTRKFRGKDGDLHFPWDSDEGWTAFIDQVMRPVIDNDLRIQINNFRCAELVSSCALVQNQAQPGASPATPTNGTVSTGQQNNTNIAKVQQAVNDSLPKELRDMLGGDFFSNIRFNLVRVTLPQAVQDAVNKAQAAYAQVSEAQAKIAQAQAEADANRKRQEGYNTCPACAEIEKIKALPPGVTVYAPGANTAVPLK
jgi:regulator of protease activity HflC (stomatin/prohibitin superfamily)